MKPGDFIVTPAWTWHDHGKESDGVDDLARRPRRAAGQSSRRDLLRRLRRRGRVPAVAAAARLVLALRLRHAAARADHAPPFAGVLLSLRAHPHGAGEHAQGQRLGRLPRPEAEVRQSGDRRLGDADHRHLRPASAEGLQDRAVPLDRGDRRDGGRRHAARRSSATRPTLCRRTTYLWCRTGPGGRWRRRTISSCSATPTVRRWKSSTSGANSAPTSRRL